MLSDKISGVSCFGRPTKPPDVPELTAGHDSNDEMADASRYLAEAIM